jgi:hypothetical protein
LIQANSRVFCTLQDHRHGHGGLGTERKTNRAKVTEACISGDAMGLRTRVLCRPTVVGIGFGILLLSVMTGCQSATSVSVNRLIAHQAIIDFSGLKAPQKLESLDIAASIPNHWEALPLQRRLIYVHQQWRAPSRNTGVGVAYVHMPLPMSAKMIIWFAKSQYVSQSKSQNKPQGKLVGQWTDSIGREWFEAEDGKYHVKGYAITSGFDAWIIYSGYRLKREMNLPEIATAARSMDSILPTPLAGSINRSALAEGR